MKNKILLSIILPCLNEAQNLPLLIPEILKNIPPKYRYEIILVNDGSSDGTQTVINSLIESNPHIRGIHFYRRFGLQQALRAGIENASGEAIITMDADGQHPPDKIPELVELWKKGYDVVQTYKKSDNSLPLTIKITRRFGYWIWNKLSDGILIPGASDFRLIDKSVGSFIRNCPENEIFLRGIVQLVAKKPILIGYNVQRRIHGHSTFTLNSLATIFLNGFVSFSVKPLRLAFITGIAIITLTTIYIVIDLIYALYTGSSIISGYKTIVFLVLLLNGFIFLYLGIIGEYIGVLFKEAKKRPHYLIAKKVNFK